MVLDEMLKEVGIELPYLEAPVKENIHSEKTVEFFDELYSLLSIPKQYRTY